PEPGAVLLVCALNFLVLTWVAVRYRLTPVHAAALFCLALGYLTAVHLVVDPPGSDLVASFLTVRTGVAVVVLAALLAAAAEGIARLGRPPDAVCYAAASGVLALGCLALTAHHGAGHPMRATLVWGVCALGALTVNGRWRQAWLTYTACALLLGTALWGLHSALPDQMSWWAAAVAVEALALAGGAAFVRRVVPAPVTEPEATSSVAAVFVGPLLRSAEWIGLAALGIGLWPTWFVPWQLEQAIGSACLLALYLLVTMLEARVSSARLAGFMLLAAVVAWSGWASTGWSHREREQLIVLVLAVTSAVMAAVSVW